MEDVSKSLVAALILCLTAYSLLSPVSGSLIASSEVQMCSRSSPRTEPIYASGEHCSKKFVVSLAVRNGKVRRLSGPWSYFIEFIALQGQSGAIYASIKFVEEKGSSNIPTRHQLAKPFRISVTKSDVYVVYPLKYVTVSTNSTKCINPFWVHVHV